MTVPEIAGATAPRAAWRPILAGDEAVAARSAVADIAAALATGNAARGYDLADGAAGAALLFGYLARVTGDAAHRDVAGALLDEAAGHVAAAPTSPSLFHGFPGVAWAADHVRSLLGEGEFALNDDIDAAVEAWLASPAAATCGFDVVTGLAGLGVYALERAGVPVADRCVDRVVAQLARAARRTPDGVVWIAPDRPDRLDLGLAHGIPGAIALLARCAERGAAGATACELLDRAVPWLLARRRGDGGFPPCIAGGRPAAPRRDGWCYGGAAVGLALVRASRVGDPAWLAAGLDVARTAAMRPASDTGVRDAGLCHGAAALGLIYQRLYHATGDPALRDAARAWVLRILDHREPADRRARGDLASTAGFFQATTDGRIPVAGLMNGAAGIGLVLLAASSDVAPDWDRALLLGA